MFFFDFAVGMKAAYFSGTLLLEGELHAFLGLCCWVVSYMYFFSVALLLVLELLTFLGLFCWSETCMFFF